MSGNSDVNLDPLADDDIADEINTLRLSCITQIISAGPITVRLVAVNDIVAAPIRRAVRHLN